MRGVGRRRGRHQSGRIMIVRVCITGGIACGKTLVGRLMAELGVPVRDADDICHELMAPGTELHSRIISAFGDVIRGPSGEINRRALSRIVCDCAEKREKLNRLVHPEARRELEAWICSISAARGANERRSAFGRFGVVAAIIPLVFEVGWEKYWDRIVCVAAPRSLQIERLLKRGLSEDHAVAWIRAQMPLDEKIGKSDYVVFNSGSEHCARVQTEKILENIVEQAEKQNGK